MIRNLQRLSYLTLWSLIETEGRDKEARLHNVKILVYYYHTEITKKIKKQQIFATKDNDMQKNPDKMM